MRNVCNTHVLRRFFHVFLLIILSSKEYIDLNISSKTNNIYKVVEFIRVGTDVLHFTCILKSDTLRTYFFSLSSMLSIMTEYNTLFSKNTNDIQNNFSLISSTIYLVCEQKFIFKPIAHFPLILNY